MNLVPSELTLKKDCFKCRRELSISNFYRHKDMADGLLGKCKDCTRADVTANRERRIDEIREYDRLRPRRRAVTKFARQYPKAKLAHTAVQWAVKAGSLRKQNCVDCGSEQSLAHHEDYNRPLDVIWYCQIHHKARHKFLEAKGIDTHK